MIAVRVFGEGKEWTGEVVATALQGDEAWQGVEKPVSVRGRRPDLVLLRAISAYRRTLQREFRCERCRHRWRTPYAKEPTYCPSCRNSWRRTKRERGMAEAERLLELATGTAGPAVKDEA